MNDERASRHEVPLVALVVALAAANGAIDAACFTRLGGVFASVMTGNLVLFGVAAERASASLLAHSAVAIGGYAAGVALGAVLCKGTPAEKVLWPARVKVTLMVELAAFSGFTLAWELVGGQVRGASQLFFLADAAIAMGLQSEAMRNVGAPLSTTYLTGTLTSTVASFVTGGALRSRANLMNVSVLGAAVAGAAAGVALTAASPPMLPVLPVVAVGGVVAAGITSKIRPSSRSAGW